MHRDFADWYRAVSLVPKAEELQKRWQALDSFAENSAATDVAELARLFYGLPHRDEKFEERFRRPFKEADESFAMRDNLAELRVLAGAALIRHFEHGGAWAAGAALAICCTDCQGLRPPPVPGILELALKDLSRQTGALRRKATTPLPKLDLTEKLQAVKRAVQNNQLPDLADPLTGVLQQLVKAFGQLTDWAEEAAEERELRQEESDVLWWLTGEHSRDLGGPFSDLKAPAACLVAPKELSDLVRALPGPYAAEAFLDNVIRKAHPGLKTPVSIADALASCPEECRTRLLAAESLDVVLDLCPIHLGVRKYVEMGGKKVWQTAFRTTSRIGVTEKLKPLTLAVQVYRERLLVRAVRAMEGANSD